MRRLLVVLVLVASAVPSLAAPRLTVLTTGKQATFRRSSAFVRVGADRALTPLVDPTCAGGAKTKIQLGAYLQSTYRVRYAAPPLAEPTLDCTRWRRAGGGFVYTDAKGSVLGVKRIVYSKKKLTIALGGKAYEFPGGPVGFVEAALVVGDTRYFVRFHNLRTNTASRIVAVKPSAAAAEGEAGFWAVLHGDDATEARMQASLDALGRAVKRDPKDGRSQFLIAMMRLYRFGQMTTDYGNVSAAAKQELIASDAAFAGSVPLLWDGAAGDSRVPGFAAATKFLRGYLEGDAEVQAQGIADLNAAVAINAFFNVFDVIPVVQALPKDDPRFQTAYQQFADYLGNPETLACLADQPEICGNVGFAPRNLTGSLILFGDVYAKGGDLANASQWYNLAVGVDDAYEFKALAVERAATAAERVARWADDDPSNDPTVVGLGKENCATCHRR